MRLEKHCLEIHWKSIPEHGLHKHPQRLDVDPGNKGFAEVHLEPAQQWALRRREWVIPPGHSAQRQAKKGHGFCSEPCAEKKCPRPAEAESRSDKVMERPRPLFSRTPGAREAQRASQRHMRQATTDQASGAGQPLTSGLSAGS